MTMLMLMAALLGADAADLSRPPVLQPGFTVDLPDYPFEDYRAFHQGRVQFIMDVDATGKPTSCTVLEQTRFPALNKRACEIALARMHFDPALDGAGRPVAATSTKSIRWKINR